MISWCPYYDRFGQDYWRFVGSRYLCEKLKEILVKPIQWEGCVHAVSLNPCNDGDLEQHVSSWLMIGRSGRCEGVRLVA